MNYTKSDKATARKLASIANDEGTLQAADALRVMPHHKPEWHNCQQIGTAFQRLTGKPFDAEKLGLI